MFINLTSLTSLHQPTNERNLPQRQVALHDIGHKEQQQNGTVRHTQALLADNPTMPLVCKSLIPNSLLRQCI